MPTAPGTLWIYEVEGRWGLTDHPQVEHFEEQVEIIGAAMLRPSGTYLRRIARRSGAERATEMRVADGCIGSLRVTVPQSRPDLPDVCFPLHEGQTWGNPSEGRASWMVAGHGKKKLGDPVSIEPSDWRIEAHLASGDDNFVWFRKGVGIVAERTWHNGTYDDRSARVVRFLKR